MPQLRRNNDKNYWLKRIWWCLILYIHGISDNLSHLYRQLSVKWPYYQKQLFVLIIWIILQLQSLRFLWRMLFLWFFYLRFFHCQFIIFTSFCYNFSPVINYFPLECSSKAMLTVYISLIIEITTIPPTTTPIITGKWSVDSSLNVLLYYLNLCCFFFKFSRLFFI